MRERLLQATVGALGAVLVWVVVLLVVGPWWVPRDVLVRIHNDTYTVLTLAASMSTMAPGDTLYGRGRDTGGRPGEDVWVPLAYKPGPVVPPGMVRVGGAIVVLNDAGDSMFVWREGCSVVWQVDPRCARRVVDSASRGRR